MLETKEKKVKLGGLTLSSDEILRDYRLASASRHASLFGRREVMGGKAKFGIFGDGKEVAQLAMARAFRKGDFRSGYYRDQTFMFALGVLSIDGFFAQLYSHADIEADPASAGRQMNAHFATRSLNDDGSWKPLVAQYNASADVSPTGSQMPRLVGLAYASRVYRNVESLHAYADFSDKGNEIAFGTVGNATCAEGMVWEAINAAGVLKAPMLLSIWDDDYGISVSNKYQVTKRDLSALLSGFRREKGSKEGYDLYTVRGWDYAELVETYQRASASVRKHHIPAILHVIEMTQPQGHSTSGSHERYKSKERLAWEKENDCIRKMGEWIVDQGFASPDELEQIDRTELQRVRDIRDRAWERYLEPIRAERTQVVQMLENASAGSSAAEKIKSAATKLAATQIPFRRDLASAIRQALVATHGEASPAVTALREWHADLDERMLNTYGTHLHSESEEKAVEIAPVSVEYGPDSPNVTGFEVLNACFRSALEREPRLIAFGEDVGKLGDVNQGFKGLQEKFGEWRVSDTGIRECTILGQAIGMAMRGLRPLAEIQYLDYLLYALQIMSDDLATLQWRTRGGQKAPVIVRTRGHRLEGIWHSGSPMAGIISLVRGMHVLVPRNMTQAAGFYNMLLKSDEPALVVEVLNAYRLREKLPSNIDTFTIPPGVPELLREGGDITLVTYGACCSIVLDAAENLAAVGIDAEVIDARSLLPFDLPGLIGDSLRKTNRIAFIDEDVPGGATAYMLQEVVEKQNGYRWLDSPPLTISGKAHRPAFGSDGDYWSKPGVEEVIDRVYKLIQEAEPARYPGLFA